MKKLVFLLLVVLGIQNLYCEYAILNGYLVATGSFTVGSDVFLTTVSGSVGISSETPTAKLGIQGGIVASSSITAQGGFYGDGSNLTGITAEGDNLGNHIATTTLNMSSFTIVNITSMTVSDQFIVRSSTPIINTKPSFKITDYIGNELLRLHADHPYNVFLGREVGLNNQASNYPTGNYYGVDNTFVGDQAGYNNTQGSANSVFGSGAGYGLTTARGNLFAGLSAGAGCSTGFWNIYEGYNAGANNVNGSSNVVIGANAGTTGSNYSRAILIGFDTEPQASGVTDTLNIANLIWGTSVYNSGNIALGITAPTAKFHIHDDLALNNRYVFRISSGSTGAPGYLLNVSTTGNLDVNGSATFTAPATVANIASFNVGSSSPVIISTAGYTKLGGAEKIKTWTYPHTLTSDEVAAGQYTQTITAVKLSGIRSITGCIYLVSTGATRWNAPAESPRAMYITSSTSMTVYLTAGSGVANDIISVTILEAE